MNTQTLVPERAHDTEVSLPALFVVLAAGKPRAGSRHLLRGVERVVLGRGAVGASRRRDGELRIDLPDPHLSTDHAVIERVIGGWAVRDLGSKNGVGLDGERVTSSSIADGAWLQIGETFLRFRQLQIAVGAPDDVVGDAATSLLPVVERAMRRLGDVATSALPVMLLGESGVGKEVAARMVHERSKRTGAFVAINCAGMVETLAASTMFGHRRGAYTGAIEDRPGAIRAADDGTLLLDEVADLPMSTQGTLLRVLQEHEVVPVGETRAIPVDVRFVAATLRDLSREVEAGRFRVDLYARLAGLRVTLPPLRERIEDLGGLLAGALARHCGGRELGLTAAAAWALCRYRWPLNIRELDQAIGAGAAIVRADRIALEELPEQLSLGAAVDASPARREELLALLRDHHGNLAAVARVLHTSRAQIHRLLRRFDVDHNAFRR